MSRALEFLDAKEPSLTEGTYQISVAHSIDAYADQEYFTPRKTQLLEVRGPRFVLPPGTVHAAYPVPGATGTFDQVVPHIALDRMSLPWDIKVGSSHPPVPDPWLALLLFTAGELPDDPEAVGKTASRPVSELAGPAPKNVIHPELDGLPSDQKRLTCQTVDIPADLFARVAPLRTELSYLAHVRRGADAADSARTHQAAGSAVPDDRHAVVVGNRFPSPHGGQYVAHLVSLEGFLHHLPKDRKDLDSGESGTRLRMVSLHSWSFRSLPDLGPHFATLVEGLAQHGAGHPDRLTLRWGQDYGDQPADPARQRLHAGYVPVVHALPTGESSFAWYRGPLTAVPNQSVPLGTDAPVWYAADARMIFLEEHGIFDISYAAAWTMGRALALADPEFGPALMRWRQVVRRAAGRLSGGTHDGKSAVAGHGSLAGAGVLGAAVGNRHFEEAVKQGGFATALQQEPHPDRTPTTPGHAPPAQAVRARLADAAQTAAIHTAADHQATALEQWLSGLALLRRVPLDHLVPRPEMLPPESLRFFHLDHDWQLALLDGALSIGLACSLDRELTQGLRRRIRKLPQLTGSASGFLVRSALVPGWPALRVRCYQGNRQLKVLRCAALGPDLLLMLVDGVIDKLVIAEPPQGLHFGYELDRNEDPYIQLRSLRETEIGEPVSGATIPFAGFLDARRVLDVMGLRAELSSKLGKHSGKAALGAAGMAIQMIKSAQQITFKKQEGTS
ncbi:hypothetical protein [Streptomyces sp. S186]|uniref:hypothetical protein n=1 Tax=Streptomyces sp. S186 TaxID=3434395 RepID=UPI003F680829